MRIALGIYRMQPRGGLEDHCIRIAEALAARGHDVVVHAVEPARSERFAVRQLLLAGRPRSNHARMAAFADAFAGVGGCDRSVAFQPVPGVDILYCADPPRLRRGWRSLLPRHRTYARLEAACFAPEARTRVMLVSAPQAEAYRTLHGTPAARLEVVPPSIDLGKRREPPTTAARAELRRALGLPAGEPVWLWVGLQPFVKGLDRVVEALASSPAARLLVAGLREGDRAAKPFRERVARLGLERRVRWLGHLDAPRLVDAIVAADVLAHPARSDVTGAVILEAVVNGLPAVVSDACGFADHVRRSGAGLVLPPRADARDLAGALADCAGASRRWRSAQGIAYGRREDLYSGIAVAAQLIEAPDWTAARALDRSAAAAPPV